MARRITTIAWIAATLVAALIVLGAVVRITGSGMGCGDHWPLCNGHLVPPLDDRATFIEWGHRLVAGVVAFAVFGLAALAWWSGAHGARSTEHDTPLRRRAAYLAAALLVAQILLGAVTVKLDLPHWTVVLHLATAMLLLAALLAAATNRSPLPAPRSTLVTLGLVLATVLLGGVTAKIHAGTACLGFPLCNGQLWPAGNAYQHIHWTHRLLAYALVGWTGWRAVQARGRGPATIVFALVLLQVLVAAVMVLHDLPTAWRAAHVAAGTAVWAGAVLAAR